VATSQKAKPALAISAPSREMVTGHQNEISAPSYNTRSDVRMNALTDMAMAFLYNELRRY